MKEPEIEANRCRYKKRRWSTDSNNFLIIDVSYIKVRVKGKWGVWVSVDQKGWVGSGVNFNERDCSGRWLTV